MQMNGKDRKKGSGRNWTPPQEKQATMSRLGFGENKKLLFDFRQQHVSAIYDWVDEA